MKLSILLLLFIFISCEEQGQDVTVDAEPRVEIVENETGETIVEAEGQEELETLMALLEGDYEAECVDNAIIMIEVKETKIEITETNYQDADCTIWDSLDVTSFDPDDFYGDYLIQKDGDKYIVDGLEFTLK